MCRAYIICAQTRKSMRSCAVGAFLRTAVNPAGSRVKRPVLTRSRTLTLPCADSAGWGVHERGFEMTKRQLRRDTVAGFAPKGTGRFVVAAHLENGNDGWGLCLG